MAEGEAPNAPDQLILLGDVEYKISIEETNIPTNDNFTQVKLSGDKSVYVLYDVTDLSTGLTPDKIQVVTSTTPVPLNFTPRSAKGHSKSGLILFVTFNYGGRSQCYVSDSGDVTDKFPLGTPGGGRGVSSFMVYEGMWELFKGTNQSGGAILIDGSNQFSPGTKIDLWTHLPVNDSISSISRIGE